MSKIIECIPNFSEGQNPDTIRAIGEAISRDPKVTLKCIDTGFYANRSVYTFIGEMEAVLDAAYRAICKASECIDMRMHKGTHPRFGAIDVFPFVALKNVSFEELNAEVLALAARVSTECHINTYLYEKSAKEPYRKNLAMIRKGEYEGLEQKMKRPEWKPDFGGDTFFPVMGGMAIGVRDLLVAFNVNLDTKDVSIARKIAEEIRHSGVIVKKDDGTSYRTQGICEGVKALGWYIKDFDVVQVSMNIVDIKKSPIHIVFDTCVQLAAKYGVKVVGSELIGCIPKHCLLEAGHYYFNKENKDCSQYSELELMLKSIETLGLESLKPFDIIKNVLTDF